MRRDGKGAEDKTREGGAEGLIRNEEQTKWAFLIKTLQVVLTIISRKHNNQQQY